MIPNDYCILPSPSKEYPPGPCSIMPNRLLRDFMHDPIKTLMDTANKYGDIAHFKFGRQHVYLINNPHHIEDILIRNYKNFIKSKGLQVSNRLLGEGLVTSEGGNTMTVRDESFSLRFILTL